MAQPEWNSTAAELEASSQAIIHILRDNIINLCNVVKKEPQDEPGEHLIGFQIANVGKNVVNTVADLQVILDGVRKRFLFYDIPRLVECRKAASERCSVPMDVSSLKYDDDFTNVLLNRESVATSSRISTSTEVAERNEPFQLVTSASNAIHSLLTALSIITSEGPVGVSQARQSLETLSETFQKIVSLLPPPTYNFRADSLRALEIQRESSNRRLDAIKSEYT